jgi:ABC transporter substrate binding protein
MNLAADDPQGQARIAAFVQGLAQLGWTEGRNVQIDYRWGPGDAERYRRYAAELVGLAPDVILASASPTVAAFQQTNRTVPIVFASVIDPVGAGFVASLARPGGNGYRLYHVRICPRREMAGAAQRDRTGRDASSGPAGPCHSRWDWPVRGNSARSPCTTPARSSAPSLHSRVGRMVA